MKPSLIIIFVVVLASVIVGASMYWERKKTPRDRAFVRIRGTVIPVEIRSDPEGRMWGLSWRESLPDGEGMLFLFPKKDRYSFWMKDMKFPIDIIWMSDGRVLEITPSVPITPLKTYRPEHPVDFVLEVDAGFSERHSIRPGDPVEVVFDKNTKIE